MRNMYELILIFQFVIPFLRDDKFCYVGCIAQVIRLISKIIRIHKLSFNVWFWAADNWNLPEYDICFQLAWPGQNRVVFSLDHRQTCNQIPVLPRADAIQMNVQSQRVTILLVGKDWTFQWDFTFFSLIQFSCKIRNPPNQMSSDVRNCVESPLNSQMLLKVGKVLFRILNKFTVRYHVLFNFLGFIIVFMYCVHHLLHVVLGFHVTIVEIVHQRRRLGYVRFELFQSG